MKELLLNILPPLGWVLWGFGSSGYWPFRKGWKREIWPICCAIAAIMCGFAWWKAIIGAIIMDIAIRQGYGEDDPIWKRVLAGLAIGFSLLIFSVPWLWCLFVSAWFLALYWGSRRWNWLSWAWVQGSTGLWQGVSLLQSHWF